MGIVPFGDDVRVPHALPACPAWCCGGHGEPDGGADADGLHHYRCGLDQRLPGLLNSHTGTVLRDGTGGFVTGLTRCDSWDGPYGIPLIELESSQLRSDGYSSVTVLLTGSEARSLSATLVHLAELAEGLR